MRKDKEYLQAIAQVKENLADLNERGAGAVGENVLQFMESILTPDEIVESELRVSVIGELIKARQVKGISQKAGRIKRGETACHCKNGRRYHQSAVRYDFEGIGAFREDVGRGFTGNYKRKSVKSYGIR